MKIITMPGIEPILKPYLIICGVKGPLRIICGHY